MEKPRIDIITFTKCKVLDENKNEIELYSLWQKQPAIIIFLRHFACIACRQHAQQVWALRDKFQSKGAKVYFIGNGSADFIKKFKEDMGIQEAPVFTDPSLLSFRAAGFKRGFLVALGPQAVVNGLKMMINNKSSTGRPSSSSGDLWQLGGTLVMGTNGKVLYHHISQALGDFSPENDIKNIVG